MYTPEMVKTVASEERDVRIRRALFAIAKHNVLFKPVSKRRSKHAFADPDRDIDPTFTVCSDKVLMRELTARVESAAQRHFAGIRRIILSDNENQSTMNEGYDASRLQAFVKQQSHIIPLRSVLESGPEEAPFEHQNEGGLMLAERTDTALEVKLRHLEAAILETTRANIQNTLVKFRQEAATLAAMSNPLLIHS